ncbi:hypothetical protein BJ741DRAFT_707820 [Chytriomyces cf. hyalinus JEL632]|nr:hypothetical protein BJ741DRAFT_707820 [Chytriomyces cf. hyalinus JEL632]
MRNFTSFDIAAISTHGILTVTGFFELAYLVYFVTVVERRVSKEISRTFSWFNITLFTLSLSLISLHASTAVCVFEQPNPFDAKIPVTIANLSYCFCELSYVWYTWLRSKAILTLKGGIRYKIAAGVVTISPGLYTAQFLIICLHLYWADETLKPVTMLAIICSASLGGVSIIAFDCVMLVAFMTFLQENQIERSHSQTFLSVQPTDRFSIIASYGRWSCCMLLGALVFYLALAVVGYGSAYGNVLEALCYAMMDGIILLLAGMKMALHWCDVKEEQADSLLRHGGSKGSVGRGEFTSVSISRARSDGNLNAVKGEVGAVRSSEVKAKSSLKYEARPVR